MASGSRAEARECLPDRGGRACRRLLPQQPNAPQGRARRPGACGRAVDDRRAKAPPPRPPEAGRRRLPSGVSVRAADPGGGRRGTTTVRGRAERSVFADEARIRAIRHRGEHFSVDGPLNIHRPPQGRPVLVQAGRSEEGRDFAATYADVVFAAADNVSSAQAFYADMKDRARRKGRDPETLKILLGTHVVLGATEAEALALEREWVDGIDIGKAIAYLQTVVSPHLRLAELPLDEPIPVTLLEEAEALREEQYQRGAGWLRTHHGQTVRQLVIKHRQNSLHLGFTGTPEKVAAELAELFQERAADGFVLSHSHLPEGLELLTQGVAQALRRAGLFRHDYDGPTLKHHLGIM
ncbi:LLM class flavin-dependent oxidoreductase [Streptomyces sp. NPDC060035]|uniref:LLM class flavin-dependent oxidoreductase n=1 Tax=Streptomyces sp. NPDC060035 TaxID=3347044 RepID=UPI0036C58AE1